MFSKTGFISKVKSKTVDRQLLLAEYNKSLNLQVFLSIVPAITASTKVGYSHPTISCQQPPYMETKN